MNDQQLSELISDISADTVNNNKAYIEKSVSEDLNVFAQNNSDADVSKLITKLFQSYLRTAIELSTINTLNVLRKLDVLPHQDKV